MLASVKLTRDGCDGAFGWFRGVPDLPNGDFCGNFARPDFEWRDFSVSNCGTYRRRKDFSVFGDQKTLIVKSDNFSWKSEREFVERFDKLRQTHRKS